MVSTRNKPDTIISKRNKTTDTKQTFSHNGIDYESYHDYVQAKRRRNMEVLQESGLMDAKAAFLAAVPTPVKSSRTASQRGIKRTSASKTTPEPRRKSNRIAGVRAKHIFVDEELRGGRVIVSGVDVEPDEGNKEEEVRYFNERVNDGSDLSLNEAVDLCASKWTSEKSVETAQKFLNVLPGFITASSRSSSVASSPTSVMKIKAAKTTKIQHSSLASQVDSLQIDDMNYVAKVTPERIYAMACHPSPHFLLGCAGDKEGYVGLWNVNSRNDEDNNNGVHIFKPHSGVVTHLEWNASGSSLYSISYDGSVREFDVQSQVFRELFATYDDSEEFKDKLGFGLEVESRSWVQYGCLDKRNEQGLFLTTALGNLIHLDFRAKKKLTFCTNLSEKKINSVSLHPNETTIATAGLDTTIKIWDIRNLPSSKTPKPLAFQQSGKSVNSAFFSPSGSSLVATTMANYLDITHDPHLLKNRMQPSKRIRHDNMTGRWLSTFMARWHPEEDIFVVGSMQQPRTIEIFNKNGVLLRGVQGDALTAVGSRCCFHPGRSELVVLGGNSSGRVSVVKGLDG